MIHTHRNLGMAAKLLLLAIAERSDSEGWSRYEVDELTHFTGANRSEVIRAMAALVSQKLIVFHRADEGLFTQQYVALSTVSTGLSTTPANVHATDETT